MCKCHLCTYMSRETRMSSQAEPLCPDWFEVLKLSATVVSGRLEGRRRAGRQMGVPSLQWGLGLSRGHQEALFPPLLLCTGLAPARPNNGLILMDKIQRWPRLPAAQPGPSHSVRESAVYCPSSMSACLAPSAVPWGGNPRVPPLARPASRAALGRCETRHPLRCPLDSSRGPVMAHV